MMRSATGNPIFSEPSDSAVSFFRPSKEMLAPGKSEPMSASCSVRLSVTSAVLATSSSTSAVMVMARLPSTRASEA